MNLPTYTKRYQHDYILEFAGKCSSPGALHRRVPRAPCSAGVVHSSIVLALTVVKAVRIVGYSTLDVASAALQARRGC